MEIIMIKSILTPGNPKNVAANKVVNVATGIIIPAITAVAAIFTAAQNANGLLNKKK